MTPARAIFVFTADQDLLVFLSSDDAAGYMEAIDVEAGEYPAIYTDEGDVIEATAAGQTVVLTDTGRSDSDDLTSRIARYCQMVGAPTSVDRVAFANVVLGAEWEARWPQRPRWLSRRIHGETPPNRVTGPRSPHIRNCRVKGGDARPTMPR